MFLNDNQTVGDPDDTLGGRIVYAREAQNLTTSQLARRLGIKTTTLQGWETDRAEPRSNRLITLAGMLNVSPTWLLMGSGARPGAALSASDMQQLRGTVTRLRKQVETLADELDRLGERLETYQSYQD